MYQENELVRIARREKNTKRKYLVVNRLQGKHVPVSPKVSLAMFEELAEQVKEAYPTERLLLVGFAETATAIGAALAVKLGCLYMQTTREKIPGVEYLYFSESHSHATEQKLVRDDIDKVIDGIDRIVFVEDEVTTGNTILNIINILQEQYPGKVRFSVASILNGMNEEARSSYESREIALHYLVKTDHDEYTAVAERYSSDGYYQEEDFSENNSNKEEIVVDAVANARRCVDSAELLADCDKTWKLAQSKIAFNRAERILVIGTEEFMFPAIYIGAQIEKLGCEVRTHSTTRSPIEVCQAEEYPLHRRYRLRSLYDAERITFLYDIAGYDRVLIITDAQANENQGMRTLQNALCSCGNTEIDVIRWNYGVREE